MEDLEGLRVFRGSMSGDEADELHRDIHSKMESKKITILPWREGGTESQVRKSLRDEIELQVLAIQSFFGISQSFFLCFSENVFVYGSYVARIQT